MKEPAKSYKEKHFPDLSIEEFKLLLAKSMVSPGGGPRSDYMKRRSSYLKRIFNDSFRNSKINP